jgi:hypothetical protein
MDQGCIADIIKQLLLSVKSIPAACFLNQRLNRQTTQHRFHLTAFPFAALRGRFAAGAGTAARNPRKVVLL